MKPSVSTLTPQLLRGDAVELEGFAALRQGAAQVVVWIEQARAHMVEWHLLPAKYTHTQILSKYTLNVCLR